MGIEVRLEGVIFDQNYKIALVLHKKEDKEYWVLPGGHLEYGETYEDGLKRELMEELGLEDVIVDELLFADEFINEDLKRHILKLGFSVTIPDESFVNLNVVTENESVKSVKMFSKNDIIYSENVFFPSKDFLVNLVELRSNINI